MSFVTWPDIAGFHNVYKSVQKVPEILGGRTTVRYRPKVKLHGTNAAVQVRGNKVFAQSRTQLITSASDNAGFAAWVEKNADAFRHAAPGRDVILYGEWCGPGVNKGVAVNKISSKVFALFAAMDLPFSDEATLLTSEDELSIFVRQGLLPDTHIIPFCDGEVTIHFHETTDVIQSTLDAINQHVTAVETCDPWVKHLFDVEGTGEGLVFYPERATYGRFSNLAFKAKGEKHKVVSQKSSVQIDPAVAESIEGFATLVLPDARLEQGVRAISRGELVFDKKLVGPFLGWVLKDVEKETQAELEASGLTWKQVQKAVSDKARAWYVSKAETL